MPQKYSHMYYVQLITHRFLNCRKASGNDKGELISYLIAAMALRLKHEWRDECAGFLQTGWSPRLWELGEYRRTYFLKPYWSIPSLSGQSPCLIVSELQRKGSREKVSDEKSSRENRLNYGRKYISYILSKL